MLNLNNKIIWITGASSGIGEASAYEFANNKTKLILTARNKTKLNDIKQKCLKLGAISCDILEYDLADIENIDNLVQKAISFNGKIDFLFNNAGISQRALAGDSLFEVDKKIMDVNFFAPIKIAKLLIPHFIENNTGTFIVTTSITGRFGFPLRSAYSASKHALYGYFETIQAEYFQKNIKVLIVCPGRVNTNISYYALEKDGTQHSKLDAGQAGGISSQKAAKKIIKAVKKQKTEITVGGKELLMLYIKRFLPALSKKLIRKIKPE